MVMSMKCVREGIMRGSWTAARVAAVAFKQVGGRDTLLTAFAGHSYRGYISNVLIHIQPCKIIAFSSSLFTSSPCGVAMTALSFADGLVCALQSYLTKYAAKCQMKRGRFWRGELVSGGVKKGGGKPAAIDEAAFLPPPLSFSPSFNANRNRRGWCIVR